MSKKHAAHRKAVLYARTDSMRRSEHAPIDAQIKVLRKYAANNGFDIAREFIDETRASLIAKIFEWVASGERSIDELSTKACDLGLSYQKSGKPVPTSTVYKILRNPFYAGRFVWNNRMYQGRHESIISMKLWKEIENVLNERENEASSPWKSS